MTNYSLGEIDSLARKATRGAGYSWGVAEEAGKAVRWLSAYGYPGAEILANYLTIVANKSQEFIPSLLSESSNQNIAQSDKAKKEIDLEKIVFTNNDLAMCSLYCGTLINDLGHQLKDNKSLIFENMLSPLLALSQAGRIAEAYDISVSFAYAETVIVCSANGIQLKDSSAELGRSTPPLFDNNLSASSKSDPETYKEPDSFGLNSELMNNTADVVCCQFKNTQINTHFPNAQSRAVSTEALAILEQFAHTTYAPATEESRLKGAG